MIDKIGAQLYTIRSLLTDKNSVASCFERLKSIGYDEIQPAGYCGLDVKTFASLASGAGLGISGTLCDFNELIANPDKAMAEHELLKTKYIGVSIMPGSYRDTPEHIMEFIGKAVEFSEIIGKRGFKFTYHNHSFEFRKIFGKRVFDHMIERFDPEYTSFVLDTYWVQHGGGDVIAWMKKLAGRIDILHLKDMGMEDTQFFTEIGNGNINFDGIIPVSEEIGVSHYVVEQDTCPGDPFESLAASRNYIKEHYSK